MTRRTLAAVYILISSKRTVLYVGVTSNLALRMAQHRAGTCPGFTKRYGARYLVRYEWHEDIRQAIAREKQIKAGSRAARITLIEETNPDWRDLAGESGLV
jgi:predicted GIY-YIG superfamily endonuclease